MISSPHGADRAGWPTGSLPGVAPLPLRDVVRLLELRYPPHRAERWDAVGLVVGDPDRAVRKVALAVDPVAETVAEAVKWGADLLLTHHPLLLDGVHSVAATTAKGRVVHQLVAAGCALYAAHTNADAAPGGVAEALADVLGVTGYRPLVPAPADALDLLVVYVPVGEARGLVDALSAAGAGGIGDYEQCAWTVDGLGQFLPRAGARPAVGRVGRLERVGETRVEMVLPRSLREAVVAALRAAHSYEEPAFSILEIAPTASRTGSGRVGALAATTTLGDFAREVADAVPATTQGVRVSGDLDAPVRRVAVCGGSGGSLFSAAREAGADVYVTADLRHHVASEAREDVGGGPPYLIDLAHWSSEWPWLPRAAADLAADVAATGATVETRVSTLVTDPWTARFAPAASVTA